MSTGESTGLTSTEVNTKGDGRFYQIELEASAGGASASKHPSSWSSVDSHALDMTCPTNGARLTLDPCCRHYWQVHLYRTLCTSAILVAIYS